MKTFIVRLSVMLNDGPKVLIEERHDGFEEARQAAFLLLKQAEARAEATQFFGVRDIRWSTVGGDHFGVTIVEEGLEG